MLPPRGSMAAGLQSAWINDFARSYRVVRKGASLPDGLSVDRAGDAQRAPGRQRDQQNTYSGGAYGGRFFENALRFVSPEPL